LRIAIGWHFLYEGLEKIFSTPEGRSSYLARVIPPQPAPAPMEKPEAPFTAEPYLRNATGPWASYFRELVPDVYGEERLDFERLKLTWTNDLERYAEHYQMTPPQHEQAEQALQKQIAVAEQWFKDPENADKVKKYLDNVTSVLHRMEHQPGMLESERAQVYKDRASLEADRRGLMQTVDGWTASLHEAWKKAVQPEQLTQHGSMPWTRLDWIDTITKYGLTAVGVGLLFGLLTRLSALGAAGYLLMFYLSMPPWPGLPPAPNAEGHYLFVNKNLVEMLACLTLASLPTGHWVGLDALLFGWLRRRRARSDDRVDNQPALFDPPSSGIR
jgi:uncharacterized membrane protein YphA (DoxX/SURF4 family)